MNLARHAAVVWRFRAVAAAGVALGIILATLASYQIGWKGGPSFTPRGEEVWTAVSSILVTQPGFPEGRVTLPEKQTDKAVTADGRPAVTKNAPPADQVEFADPGRLAHLADLYSKFLTSADVLARIPGRPKAAQIEASPFLASAGGQTLPIIQLSTNAGSAKAAERLNLAIHASLRRELTLRQQANEIAVGRRVEVRIINPPATTLTSGRARTMSILALLLSGLGTLAVVHILEALRINRARGNDDRAPLVSWTPGTPSVAPPFDETHSERLLPPERVSGAAAPDRQAAGGRQSHT